MATNNVQVAFEDGRIISLSDEEFKTLLPTTTWLYEADNEADGLRSAVDVLMIAVLKLEAKINGQRIVAHNVTTGGGGVDFAQFLVDKAKETTV